MARHDMTGHLRKATFATALAMAMASFTAQPALADSGGDWAASQFVSKTVHVGIAGYFFQQITDDSGPGAKLGGFRGQAVGIGPQIGFVIPMSDGYQGYLNIRGYKDLEVENRPSSWSTWVTFSLSQAASAPAATKPIVRKY
jgi:hypothetical protein